MAVDAAEKDGPAVDQKLPVARFGGAEADAPGDDFEGAALRVADGEEQGVQRGRLGRPQRGRGDGGGERDRRGAAGRDGGL
ncbi:hypothetical protein OH491_03295 [Termitidicoccus mucosus]